ncbi:MAG: R3H domain-containing nucleic acid-binding protein [bacterium]|nr:R3H domain-containing nucleic acid-binding protein [bacterium]
MDKAEITSLIKELIEKTSVSVSNISVTEDEGKTTWFGVEVDNPHLFYGRGGEALLALNHLVRKIIEGKSSESLKENLSSRPDEMRILIDINGFQKKRVEGVKATAHMMAERARYFKSNIEIDPMSAFERRIIHEFLSEATDLKTESMGEGPSRRVVIKYIGSL